MHHYKINNEDLRKMNTLLRLELHKSNIKTCAFQITECS